MENSETQEGLVTITLPVTLVLTEADLTDLANRAVGEETILLPANSLGMVEARVQDLKQTMRHPVCIASLDPASCDSLTAQIP